MNKHQELNAYNIGEVIWSKINGFPWWPSIILSIEKDNKYKVAFLGERDSYQFLSHQWMKKWCQISSEKGGKKKGYSKIFHRAVAYGKCIYFNELSYDQHVDYLNYIDHNSKDQNENGVEQFKEYINSLNLSMQIDQENNNNNKEEISNEELVQGLTNEIKVIDSNMNDIINQFPPEKLIQRFLIEDIANNNNTDDITLNLSTQEIALSNYLNFISDMFHIQNKTSNAISLLLNNSNDHFNNANNMNID